MLQTAWKIDKLQDYRAVRGDISAIKAMMPRVLNNVASRPLQIHGSLDLTDGMAFMRGVIRWNGRSTAHWGKPDEFAQGAQRGHRLTQRGL